MLIVSKVLYLDTKALQLFVFFLVSEAQSRCRVVVVAKLNIFSRAQLW